MKAFWQIARALKRHTDKCVISFVNIYSKNKKNLDLMERNEINQKEFLVFAKELTEIAYDNGIRITSCAETIDLSQCGIEHNCCIDKQLIEKIIGCNIKTQKDKNQRTECGCVESIEMGTYNTCLNECKYCYANYNLESVQKNFGNYNADSPLLCSTVVLGDKITDRKVKSLKEKQLSLFDYKRVYY